ncbi:hypothetical protein BDV19DRAFT_390350 [Aspergillus venezuelensis]
MAQRLQWMEVLDQADDESMTDKITSLTSTTRARPSDPDTNLSLLTPMRAEPQPERDFSTNNQSKTAPTSVMKIPNPPQNAAYLVAAGTRAREVFLGEDDG